MSAAAILCMDAHYARSERGQGVDKPSNFLRTPSACRDRCYDAATMRRASALLIAVSTFALALRAHPAAADSSSSSPSVAQAPAAGAISLVVRPAIGAEALAISGTGPAGTLISLTLYATFSRDLPDVVLTRRTVFVDPSGTFKTTTSIAPGFLRGALITVFAASPPSGPSATAYVTVGAPNITVPPDNFPRNSY